MTILSLAGGGREGGRDAKIVWGSFVNNFPKLENVFPDYTVTT